MDNSSDHSMRLAILENVTKTALIGAKAALIDAQTKQQIVSALLSPKSNPESIGTVTPEPLYLDTNNERKSSPESSTGLSSLPTTVKSAENGNLLSDFTQTSPTARVGALKSSPNHATAPTAGVGALTSSKHATAPTAGVGALKSSKHATAPTAGVGASGHSSSGTGLTCRSTTTGGTGSTTNMYIINSNKMANQQWARIALKEIPSPYSKFEGGK